MAISGALNDFSLSVVPHVVEVEHLGRVIYAGGDDVLAMLPVADLLPAMQRLRQAWSGHDPAHEKGDRQGLVLRDGFALLGGRLLRMMGRRATASCGAVVAHHQAPLGAVLRALRQAEQGAKNEGERDAFSLTIIKRSGGAITVTDKFHDKAGEPLALFNRLCCFLAEPEVSRRAVYNAMDWLKDLPDGVPGAQPDLLVALLTQQFLRQCDAASARKHGLADLCKELAALAVQRPKPRTWLATFMTAAEFIARDTRQTA